MAIGDEGGTAQTAVPSRSSSGDQPLSLSLTVRFGVGAGVGCDETCFWCDLLAVSLSLSSIFLGWKSFEGKIKPKNEFWVRQGILQSTRKMNSV